jgi:hypothetical protein
MADPLENAGHGRIIRPPVAWITEHRRYYEYLAFGLEELGDVALSVEAQWPDNAPLLLPVEEMPPALHRLCRQRDALAASLVMFAAMAVEAFVNYYGVVRLGEEHYTREYERSSAERKLRGALEMAEGLVLAADDPLVVLARRIAGRRNDLVHPKAQELYERLTPEERLREEPLARAREAVADCREFFARFATAVPAARSLLPIEPAI